MIRLYAASLLLLAGCAASDPMTHRMLEQGGRLAIGSSNIPGYDYQVTLGRAIDIGFDTADPETRLTIIRSYFSAQCKTVELGPVREIKLPGSFGVEQFRWIYDVKCAQ